MAEKLQALVQLRMLNSRMKDYSDLWFLSRHLGLNKATLQTAIERTFRNRQMEIEVIPVGLSAEFGNDPGRQAQWGAFRKRSVITQVPKNLTDVVEELQTFSEPIRCRRI